MSGAAPDLITGYLEELCSGLRVPADEAELIGAGSVPTVTVVCAVLAAGCLAVAAGYGLQAALRRARRMLAPGMPGRLPGRADRDGAGRAYA